MGRMRAIPTVYAGVQFRSRLEARWAAFFDVVGWPWEYEPLDLAGYIPDFVLAFPMPMLVEVKPHWYPGASSVMETDGSARAIDTGRPGPDRWQQDLCSNEERQSANEAYTKIFRSGWRGEALVVGSRLVRGTHFQSSCFADICKASEHADLGSFLRFGVHSAFWFRCRDCGRPSFASMMGSWSCRVCSVSLSFPSGQAHHEDSWDAVADFREAGNRVQWRRPKPKAQSVPGESVSDPDAPIVWLRPSTAESPEAMCWRCGYPIGSDRPGEIDQDTTDFSMGPEYRHIDREQCRKNAIENGAPPGEERDG